MKTNVTGQVQLSPALDLARAEVFQALAHPMRLQILEMLRTGEVCVCHIQATLSLRQAYVSQHLMELRKAGLVTSRKEGQRVFYQAADRRVFGLLDRSLALVQAQGRAGDGERAEMLSPAPGTCPCPRCTGL